MAQIGEELYAKLSTLDRAVWAMAFVQRFLNKLREHKKPSEILSVDQAKMSCKEQVLTVNELERAKQLMIKKCQANNFAIEIERLAEGKEVPSQSRLKLLYPFLDSNGILRVGGGLQRSEFSYNKKHPIILPPKSHFTSLIVGHAHMQTKHGGNQLTLCQVRHEYWILGAKWLIKAYVKNALDAIVLKYDNMGTDL